MSDATDDLSHKLAQYCADEDTDLFLLSGEISSSSIAEARNIIRDKNPRRKNVRLFMATPGGDPHAAYRLARALQHYYGGYRLLVFGPCKSAGTLIAVGATSIGMAEHGEFGPLDVQIAKRDDLFGQSSGLDLFQSLASMRTEAQAAFDSSFMRVLGRGAGAISTKLAAEIAVELVKGIYAPIASQIEPLRLGEMQRAIDIANSYGTRLRQPRPLTPAIQMLVTGYPAHGFVIDLQEAKSVFDNVSTPDAIECLIGTVFRFALETVLSPGTFNDLETLVCGDQRVENQRDSHASSPTGADDSGNLGRNDPSPIGDGPAGDTGSPSDQRDDRQPPAATNGRGERYADA